MNERIKNRLIGGLEKAFEDCIVNISAAYLQSCGNDNTETIIQCLKEWEQEGFLKIKKPYQECQASDICVKMLNFIDSGPPHDRFWENPHLIRQLEED
jgi:hypothetical protein